MPLKPVRKVLVSDGIVEQLKGLVDSGELSPGSRLLSETKLAEQMSVSRSSLREALNALVHLGYLERKNRGLCVAPDAVRRVSTPSPISRSKEEVSIAEMIEIRRIVETQLSSLAAKEMRRDSERTDSMAGRITRRASSIDTAGGSTPCLGLTSSSGEELRGESRAWRRCSELTVGAPRAIFSFVGGFVN